MTTARHRRPQLLGTRPTSGERAALIALCQPGAKEATAAIQLGIQPDALRARLKRLYRRLGVNSAAQAVWMLYVQPEQDTATGSAPST